MAHTILLADDSVTVRRVVELTFRGTDVRVEAVGSGEEALERYRARRPDLVLADVSMPEPTGFEVCRLVKDSDPTIPVLLLCGAFETFDEERARTCGADGHVIKPFQSDDLLSRVVALLARPPRPGREGEAEAALLDLEEEHRDEAASTVEGALVAEEETPGAHGAREVPVVPTGEDAEAVSVQVGPSPEGASGISSLSDADLDTLARAVVSRLSGDAVREIAWEVVPELAEILIKERIRQLESEEAGGR